MWIMHGAEMQRMQLCAQFFLLRSELRKAWSTVPRWFFETVLVGSVKACFQVQSAGGSSRQNRASHRCQQRIGNQTVRSGRNFVKHARSQDECMGVQRQVLVARCQGLGPEC